LVGTALKRLPDESVIPWHRVVNARGEISRRGTGDSELEQRILLEDEGVAFDRSDRINLCEYGWRP
jgi:methylated-DNA-protein-cysteine methyltransferase-like protein